MALPTPNTAIELFAGAGGIASGLRRAVAGLRTVCYVEREAYAAAVLVARMGEAALDPAPVWDDVVTFDGRPWRGVVDLIAGGFPCQDVSNAGKRAGLDGERSGLWREFKRIIDEVQPRYVFIENVAALKSRGLDRVLGDLAELGFDAEWCCLRASDAGAPHQRNRIFILAYAQQQQLRDEPGRRGGTDGPGASEPADTGEELAHTDGERRYGVNPLLQPWGSLEGHLEVARCGPELGDAYFARLEGRSLRDGGCPDEWAARSAVPPRKWPPGPDDADGWREVLSFRPDLEPAVRRMADGMADRVDRLRVCGNGVVPAQAALAWRILWDRVLTST